jgi:predicted permease
MTVCVGVLLIVAANVANLLLARATDRRKEIAIRMAMGAGQGRLMRQLLTESVLLALAGGVLGVIFASWAVSLLHASLPHTYLPIGIDPALDGWTLGFTLLVSLGTSVIFGLVPALQASRQDLQTTLKEGGQSSASGASRHWLRNGLVTSEIALALALLVGAGLCIRSAQRAYHADLGFNPKNVLLVGLRIEMSGYNDKTGSAFYQKLQERIQSAPGIQAAALSSHFPLGYEGNGMHEVTVDGHSRQADENDFVSSYTVSPGYFATLRIPLLAGRDFADRDNSTSAPVGIINETMARRYWPGQDPIGHKFRENGKEVTVIGVTPPGKYGQLNEAPQCQYYRPYRQDYAGSLGICLRVEGDPAAMAGPLQKLIHQVDPLVDIWVTIPATEFIKPSFLAPDMASRLMTALGIVALGLSALGVYGVVAYIVGQRTREFGIRMALGATSANLLRLVLRKGLTLAAVGVGAGLLLAAAEARALASLLYGVQPFDPPIFFGLPLVLVGVCLLASWLPARRAARVDPLVALRSE